MLSRQEFEKLLDVTEDRYLCWHERDHLETHDEEQRDENAALKKENKEQAERIKRLENENARIMRCVAVNDPDLAQNIDTHMDGTVEKP